MVYEFLGLLVESYGTWLLLQRLVDASKDSDIPINNRNTLVHAMVGGGEEVRWLVTASGRGWGLRGCRQDGGGQGSCSHHPGSDFAVGGPACSALCSHVRPVGR